MAPTSVAVTAFPMGASVAPRGTVAELENPTPQGSRGGINHKG